MLLVVIVDIIPMGHYVDIIQVQHIVDIIQMSHYAGGTIAHVLPSHAQRQGQHHVVMVVMQHIAVEKHVGMMCQMNTHMKELIMAEQKL